MNGTSQSCFKYFISSHLMFSRLQSERARRHALYCGIAHLILMLLGLLEARSQISGQFHIL